jgi:hypothetical protein
MRDEDYSALSKGVITAVAMAVLVALIISIITDSAYK